MPEVHERIVSELDQIEREEDVVILLAVESGSRAWGFESADSDFDVRFVYVHRPEWYVSIDVEDRRDVIERRLQYLIDISGWDIRKALRLFRKSNPPLLEWLQCPIIYREQFSFASQLRKLLPVSYFPQACFFHYLHMAQGNLREYLTGETVWRKKYLYVLRPLLALRWIEAGLGPVPIEFSKLVEATVPVGALRSAIDEFVSAKKAGKEMDFGPKIPAISDFVESEIARFSCSVRDQPLQTTVTEQLNELFRTTLTEVWGKNHSWGN